MGFVILAAFTLGCSAGSPNANDADTEPPEVAAALDAFCSAAQSVTEVANRTTLTKLLTTSEAFLDVALSNPSYGAATDNPVMRDLIVALATGEEMQTRGRYTIGDYESMSLVKLDTIAVPSWTRWALDDAEPNGLGGVELDAVALARVDDRCGLDGRVPAALPICGTPGAEAGYCATP